MQHSTHIHLRKLAKWVSRPGEVGTARKTDMLHAAHSPVYSHTFQQLYVTVLVLRSRTSTLCCHKLTPAAAKRHMQINHNLHRGQYKRTCTQTHAPVSGWP